MFLKKATDREPHKVTRYAFAKRSVTECSLQNMLYSGFKTKSFRKFKFKSLNFTFTLLCGASKGFTKALKVLIMNFGALV